MAPESLYLKDIIIWCVSGAVTITLVCVPLKTQFNCLFINKKKANELKTQRRDEIWTDCFC